MNLLGVQNIQYSVALGFLNIMTINFKIFMHWITLCIYSKSLLFVFIFKHWPAPRSSRKSASWKSASTVLEKSCFFSSKSVGTLGDAFL